MRRAALFAVAILACDPLDIRLFPERVDVTAPPDSAGDSDAAPAVVTPPDPPPDAAPSATCSPRCLACIEDAACDADERCHPFTGQCVAPCGPGQTECPDDDEVCNEELGVCVSCTDDVGCTSGDLEICDARQGICVECMDDSHCTDDPQERPRCLAALGVCGCESDADCPSGVCDEDEAQCEEDDEVEN